MTTHPWKRIANLHIAYSDLLPYPLVPWMIPPAIRRHCGLVESDVAAMDEIQEYA